MSIPIKNCKYIISQIDQFIADCEEKKMFDGRYMIKAVLLNRKDDEKKWLATLQKELNIHNTQDPHDPDDLAPM